MLNPVVVFLDVTRDVSGWHYTGELPLPFGWDFDGKSHPFGKDISFELLFLSDIADIPAPVHINKDSKAPIPVIRHRGSEMHLQNDLRAQFDLGAQLKEWGVYLPVGDFSHDDGNETFCRLRDVLEGRLAAAAFAKQFGIAAQLAHLVELAALCQIKILDAKSDVQILIASTLSILPDHFVKEFRQRAGGRSLDNPSAGLEQVLKYAQELRS